MEFFAVTCECDRICSRKWWSILMSCVAIHCQVCVRHCFAMVIICVADLYIGGLCALTKLVVQSNQLTTLPRHIGSVYISFYAYLSYLFSLVLYQGTIIS